MRRHPHVPLWVQVGDVAANDGSYFAPVAPLYWIKGNNEDFDVVARAIAGHPPAPTLHYLPNGGPYAVGPWQVAALGGTFAPNWYHTKAAALPPARRAGSTGLKLGKSRDDKRRHFVVDEVQVCRGLAGIDVFLTHEAPRPFHPAGKRIDAGKTAINTVLAAMQPAAAPVRTSPRVHRLDPAGRAVDRARRRGPLVRPGRRRHDAVRETRHVKARAGR